MVAVTTAVVVVVVVAVDVAIVVILTATVLVIKYFLTRIVNFCCEATKSFFGKQLVCFSPPTNETFLKQPTILFLISFKALEET